MEETKNVLENEELEEMEDEIVELIADDGRKLKFYFIGTLEHKDKIYVAFEPAEEIEGVELESLVIFELAGETEEDSELLPITNEKLLEEVYNAFVEAMECDDEDDCDCGCHCHEDGEECHCHEDGEECHCHEEGKECDCDGECHCHKD